MRLRRCMLVGAAVMVSVASIALVGCGKKSGGGMSQEDVKKLEAGPPKEAPPEAKAAFAKAQKDSAPKGPAGAKGP